MNKNLYLIAIYLFLKTINYKYYKIALKLLKTSNLA